MENKFKQDLKIGFTPRSNIAFNREEENKIKEYQYGRRIGPDSTANEADYRKVKNKQKHTKPKRKIKGWVKGAGLVLVGLGVGLTMGLNGDKEQQTLDEVKTVEQLNQKSKVIDSFEQQPKAVDQYQDNVTTVNDLQDEYKEIIESRSFSLADFPNETGHIITIEEIVEEILENEELTAEELGDMNIALMKYKAGRAAGTYMSIKDKEDLMSLRNYDGVQISIGRNDPLATQRDKTTYVITNNGKQYVLTGSADAYMKNLLTLGSSEGLKNNLLKINNLELEVVDGYIRVKPKIIENNNDDKKVNDGFEIGE